MEKDKQSDERILLSNSLASFIKYIFYPIFCVMALTIIVLIYLTTARWQPTFVVFAGFLFIIVLTWFYVRKYKHVSYDEEFLYVREFRKERKIELKHIHALNEASMFNMDSAFEIELHPVRGSIEKIDFMPATNEHLIYSLNDKLTGNVLHFKRTLREMSKKQTETAQSF